MLYKSKVMQEDKVNDYKAYDIIVCGLGPVGLLTCNTLGLRGYQVLGVDRFEKAFSFPRAIHMDEEIVRIVQSVGLLDELLPQLKPSGGLELTDEKFNVLFRAKSVFPGGFSSDHFLFLQPELETILRNGCKRFPNVNLVYKGITDFEQSNDGITVFSNTERLASAKYMIACDGANSFTRNKLGINREDLRFDKDILKIDALEVVPTPDQYNTVQKICSHKKPWVRMNGISNHKRWELNYTNGLSKEEIQKPEKIKQLLSEIGADTGNLQIQHGVLYSVKSVLAKEWQCGNIILAGDAAHTTPPYTGQGMAAGFRDVMNFTWKLDAVLQKQWPDSILKTYQTERYPHVKFNIRLAILVGWIFTTRLWMVLKVLSKIPLIKGWLLNFHLPKNPLGNGFWGTGKAKRYLFPQVKIDQNTYSDMLLSNEWTLVSIGKSRAPHIAGLCEKLKLKYVVFDTEPYAEELRKWAERKAYYFIVRPDLYVFSSGNSAEKLCREFQLKMKNISSAPTKKI